MFSYMIMVLRKYFVQCCTSLCVLTVLSIKRLLTCYHISFLSNDVNATIILCVAGYEFIPTLPRDISAYFFNIFDLFYRSDPQKLNKAEHILYQLAWKEKDLVQME